MLQPTPFCLRLLRQLVREAFSFAFERAGKSSAARIAMMAITTSNSIKVKAPDGSRRDRRWFDTCITGSPAADFVIRCSMIQFYHFAHLQQRGFFALSFENCALTSPWLISV